MKRKKNFDFYLEKTINAKFNLENLLLQLDDPTTEIIINSFKEATKILKEKRLAGFNLEIVENIIDQIQEEMEEAQQVSDQLSKLSMTESFNESELLSELDALTLSESIDKSEAEQQPAFSSTQPNNTHVKLPTVSDTPPILPTSELNLANITNKQSNPEIVKY